VSPVIENTAFDTQYSNKVDSMQAVYYKFPAVAVANKAWFKAVVARTDARGQIVAMLKFGSIPSITDNDAMAWAYDSVSEVVVQLDAIAAHSSGDWYLGIYLASRVSAPVDFTVGATLGFCPNGCSGHGTCAPETSECSCDAHYTVQPDCSVLSHPLVHGEALDAQVQAYGHTYYTVPVHDDFSAGPVEMTIEFAADDAVADTEFPQLFLRFGAAPTGSEYDMQSSRPAVRKQSIHIAAHDLRAGTYTLMVNNQSPSEVTGRLSLTLTPHCAHGCSGKGTCSMAGVCECPSGTQGGDCGVTADSCREDFDLPGGGVSAGMAAVAVVLFSALGGALGVFLFKKYGVGMLAERQAEQANPDRQYNQLN
jgi:hypothetical protein